MEQQNNQYHSDIQSKVENGYFFNTKLYLQQGLEFGKTNFIAMAGFTLFYFLIGIMIVLVKSQISSILQIILIPPLSAGFFYVIRRKDATDKIVPNDFAKGFVRLMPIVGSNIFRSIFIFMSFGYLIQKYSSLNLPIYDNQIYEIAFLAALIPGIYLLVATMFMTPFIIFQNKQLFPAMESSRILLTKQWINVFVFLLVLGVANVLGALMFGLGLIFTFPFSFASIYFAFKDLMPIRDEFNKD